MPKFIHVGAEELFRDSLALGEKVYRSGFRPKHAISIWRGGTPVGLGVDTFFKMRGLHINHTSIATASYSGIDERQKEVTIKGLEHVIEAICREDKLLIIDDVYETGNTIQRIIEVLREEARANAPTEILVATIHRKPGLSRHDHHLCCLRDIDPEAWVDYPHELADLVRADDPADEWIATKDPELLALLRRERFEPEVEEIAEPYKYVTSREILLDAVKLGINIYADPSFQPDIMLALWPGGILAGLPIHEVFKYRMLKDGITDRRVDHVAINTARSYLSYKSNIIGMRYLERTIDKNSRVLIIDSTFRSGRIVNDVVSKLKGALRRNLNLDNVRVASIYHNPDDKATWINNPTFPAPHYWLKRVAKEIVYPPNVFRLTDPQAELTAIDPAAAAILFGR